MTATLDNRISLRSIADFEVSRSGLGNVGRLLKTLSRQSDFQKEVIQTGMTLPLGNPARVLGVWQP